MHLQGSCHCQAVTFRVESPYPYPYNLCYCSICRKTAGSGGYAINICGLRATLTVEGEDHIHVYRPQIQQPSLGSPSTSPGERRFCRHCGSNLWGWDPRWPDLVYPFAGAIDTPLPTPPERKHMMLQFKAAWVQVPQSPQDHSFGYYADESLAHWHDRWDLSDPWPVLPADAPDPSNPA
ncbi:GFA family protein [Prochlorothrix hollandica]|uniref:Alanine acetyltransferase n=1 Tax=Prochlorothrix hollandica PCC 9006 = CALU 1027 TaxID=317619 RepID=A0A0M2Q235_PROHO|nr:GFA family protein [Prochlorothrix hollandica]KKJ01323.1 alanine acetyltransferase [Prochlorothrix hollandica PCC 9006 = CALU 1027]